MKNTLLVIAILCSFCAKAQITAAFSILGSKIGCGVPHSTTFIDASTNLDTWLWNFGDGGTSTVQNPVHNYLTAGTFVVQLTVQDTILGTTDIAYDTVKVGLPNAAFSGVSLFGCAPITTSFTDASTSPFGIASWAWAFGDGGTSTLQSPSYIYQTPGIYTVSLTITDGLGCGNADTKANYVQVIGPDVNFGADQTLICPNSTVNFTDSTIFGAPITGWTWSFGDGSPISNLQNPSHTYVGGGPYTVSLTVTDIDGCGRTFTRNNHIDSRDTIKPVITCPAAISINTDAGICTSTAAIGTATATDNCTVSPTITNDAPANFPIGATTVTWTATDNDGNIDTCSQIVTVIDAENPVITCPAAISINTDAGLCTSTAAIGTATATDNCTVTVSNNAPANFPTGATTVTWTATDGAGNTATCMQVVTVVDAEKPVLNCPADQTVVGDNNCEIVLANYISLATVSDNCDASPVVTQLPIAGTTLNGFGPNTITLTAIDVTGNISTCTFLVNISDTTAPIITCLTNQVAILDDNCEFFLPDYGTISSFSDNCAATLSITQIPAVGTIYTNKEIVPVNIVFQDAAGNISSCSFMLDIALNPNNSNCGSELIITTLFTPNGDGRNDTWIIKGLKEKCTVMVFNRWGQKVFESAAYNNNWSGTANGNLLPDGAYYYVINCADNTNYKGPLTILRTK